jgi:hypothetical protein
MLFWVPCYSGIHGNEDLNVGRDPAYSSAPCAGRPKVKEWLKKKRSKH